MDYPKRFKFFSDSLDTLNFNPANSTKMKREHPRNQWLRTQQEVPQQARILWVHDRKS